MSASVKKMRKVQFVELIEFVAVTEYHSFTRAAAQLGVSSAALSQSIRAAEERLGLRLLNRTTRHVAPTPAGECLLERLRVVLKDLDSALEELNEDRDRPAGYLRLAIAPTTTHVLGPGPLCGALSRNQDRGLGRRWPRRHRIWSFRCEHSAGCACGRQHDCCARQRRDPTHRCRGADLFWPAFATANPGGVVGTQSHSAQDSFRRN
jgi:transposase-like protein